MFFTSNNIEKKISEKKNVLLSTILKIGKMYLDVLVINLNERNFFPFPVLLSKTYSLFSLNFNSMKAKDLKILV